MITISNSRFSFFQFGNVYEQDVPVLVAEANDVAFQVLVTAANTSEANAFMAADVKLGLWTVADGNVHDYFADPVLFAKYRLSDTQVLLYWGNGLPNFDDYINSGTCFSLQLTFSIDATDYAFYSNALKYIFSKRYTSVLEYACDENTYGFIYCTGYTPNRVRLPLYLLRPQYNDKENIYVRHDGSFKITSSVTQKEYEAKVDYYDETAHEKIKVALSHDKVLIDSDVYTGGLRKNGAYEILWDDLPGYSETAAAKFKAFSNPYLVRNDNCAVCDSFIACVPVGGGTFSPPDGETGSAYVYNYALTGDAPFNVDVVSKPSWMTVEISGSTLQLRGTPDATGTGVSVTLTINNCSDSEVLNLNDTLDVTDPPPPPPCEDVYWEAFTDLAGATVDTPYSEFFIVGGTAPFEISGYTGPSWLTPSVGAGADDHKIFLTGTPGSGDVGTAIEVSFDVTNCETGTIHCAFTLDVVAPEPPLITFSDQSNCIAGLQPRTFKVHAPVGSVLSVKLKLSGYFIWADTVGSRDVILSANVASPGGAPLGNSIGVTYPYAGGSGMQSFSELSTTYFDITVDGTGIVNVFTNANIENGGGTGIIAGEFRIEKVDGVTLDAAYVQSICVGYSTGG